MRFALINPPWDFRDSIYFGCQEPHLPLEFGYAKAALEAEGHEALTIDGQLGGKTLEDIRCAVAGMKPDFTVVTTAPSYLFWRCAPPELRIPQLTIGALGRDAGTVVVVGPHGSTTPAAALNKLAADVVILGEPEEILPRLTSSWSEIPSICYRSGDEVVIRGGPHYSDMQKLPGLRWPDEYVNRHSHHHHRFEATPERPGAEVEASRGCPYSCTFCAKENFRNKYRRRPTGVVVDEMAALIEQGVEYIYFIDEIFLPQKDLLRALANLDVKIGIQTRIDLWNEETLDMLAAAHCVSVEAGVESITESGREYLDKKCRMDTSELADRLMYAKREIPFVQANLIRVDEDDDQEVERWREQLITSGVWANKPVPLFPYPGSPEYTRRWGQPDDLAWERAHAHYLGDFESFSDIQSAQPAPLTQLELPRNAR
jgi:B12-binding domain/radical SAM domain protein of rhizo-twelve system